LLVLAGSSPRLPHSTTHRKIAGGVSCHSPRQISYAASPFSFLGLDSCREQAAKKTPELIPLCHPLPITSVNVDFAPDEQRGTIVIEARVRVEGKTGVEMEALTAVSVAALTVYDMCKAADKSMVISDICLQKKTGGKSGTYHRQT